MHDPVQNNVIVTGTERCGKSMIANVIANARLFPTKASLSGLWGITASNGAGKNIIYYIERDEPLSECPSPEKVIASIKNDVECLVWLSQRCLPNNCGFTTITEMSTAIFRSSVDKKWLNKWSAIARSYVEKAHWLIVVTDSRGISRDAISEFMELLRLFPALKFIPNRSVYINCLNSMSSESAKEVANVTEFNMKPCIAPKEIRPLWPLRLSRKLANY